jgi:hypothetical protein
MSEAKAFDAVYTGLEEKYVLPALSNVQVKIKSVVRDAYNSAKHNQEDHTIYPGPICLDGLAAILRDAINSTATAMLDREVKCHDTSVDIGVSLEGREQDLKEEIEALQEELEEVRAKRKRVDPPANKTRRTNKRK